MRTEAQRQRRREEYRRNREQYRARAAIYRVEHRDKLSEYFRRRYQRLRTDPAFKKRISDHQRARRRKHRDHLREVERRCYEKNRERRLAYERARRALPETKARAYVNRQIRDKKFPRASTHKCVECGERAREYHHHLGYEREHWMHVLPVCAICHKTLHVVTLPR